MCNDFYLKVPMSKYCYLKVCKCTIFVHIEILSNKSSDIHREALKVRKRATWFTLHRCSKCHILKLNGIKNCKLVSINLLFSLQLRFISLCNISFCEW